MLMSKSRLEKFLYALYSLDSSDLPTPLSRIEELYKCLVTGEEAPSFEPLSRVEKYLMAILGAYNVNELPNPLSRVEVLLYKLATGDDNLDDIKSFLSEHEELLADIIRNGGTGGNIDIEYVLYNLSTEFNILYNTAEKPVKSAILKGQTLVNLANRELKEINVNINNSYYLEKNLTDNINSTKKYLIRHNYSFISGDVSSPFTTLLFYDNNWKYLGESPINESNFTHIITPKEGTTRAKIRLGRYGSSHTSSYIYRDIMLIEYQDGMENWDIPYFEGMKSVQMPVLTTYNSNIFPFKEYIEGTGATEDKDYIYVKGNFDFIIPLETDGNIYTLYVDGEVIKSDNFGEWKFIFEDDTERASYFKPSKTSFDTLNKKLIGLKLRNPFSAEFKLKKSSLCFNLKSMGQEPYKSNILTVNEEVELRGVGDVKDELNLITGELTQRIGEIVLDGSEDWVQSGMEGSTMFYTSLNDMAHKMDYLNSISCDKLTTHAGEAPLNQSASPNGIAGYIDAYGGYPNENWIYIKYADSGGSVENFKQLLSQNPISVQYELTTPVAKTVDISVVNQDGNNTELGTFDDLTHVTLSSEGLIPEAELEVATKNEEVLNTMSLEMDDISTTQTTLEETSNTQSENVDATMMATTEIYEQLL